jgi:protein-S-isoprenylcysteine O-methyltransferase Ste14
MAYYFIATSVLVLTMVFRRAPKRVDNESAVLAPGVCECLFSYSHLPFMDRGRPLFSPALSDVVALVALLFSMWARLSLGRNIGFVPAKREIVTAGAYRYVRHPIYTD